MNIFEKLSRMQNELKAPKDQKNTYGGFNYRNAEGILQALKPICMKYQVTILLTDSVEVIEGRFFLKSVAELISWDCDGETQGKVISAPGWAEFPVQKKGMDLAQMTGTASSYSKKRSLESLFALSSEKDSDAYDNTDREAEKETAMTKNKAKADAEENWRLLNGNEVEVKLRNGEWMKLSEMRLAWLEMLMKDERFNDIHDFIQHNIDTIKGIAKV